MPPVSNTVSNFNKSKLISFGTSPDTDTAVTEPESQTRLSKKARKKERHAAKVQNDNIQTVQSTDAEVTNPIAGTYRSVLSQIPHTFPRPDDTDAPVEDTSADLLTEKVSEHFTPEADADVQEDGLDQGPPTDVTAASSRSGSPPAQPGFSRRVSYNARSPPVSPPLRYARPVSYGGGMPPLPHYPRMSTSPYAQPPSQFGSPPAPHLPQQHFYHARDVDVGVPRPLNGQGLQEPSLLKHTTVPSANSDPRQGILLGFDGRISLMATERGRIEEIGALADLPGVVVDAVLLPWDVSDLFSTSVEPLVALVLHCPQESDATPVPRESNNGISAYPPASTTAIGYVTRVIICSFALQQPLADILQSQTTFPGPSFRSSVPEPPPPTGNLKLFASSQYLAVASGTSGEVYVFNCLKHDRFTLECLGKFWTSVQPQTTRRDSSHSRASDTDMSPADMTRGLRTSEHAIIDLKGRWLAISPTTAPSRPALGLQLGPDVVCKRTASVESIVAPPRPSVTCEVDSPDADSLFGKVARGVAQELVRGAKWLGDQGYQTWQNYWKKESMAHSALNVQAYSPPTYPNHHHAGVFPPTHGETVSMSREPELVSVFDLTLLQEALSKKAIDDVKATATFQPPRGCSYISFAPQGLHMLTAGRNGDVQYIWDLMQIKHCRAHLTTPEDDQIRSQPRVRQIARYERLSGATIVDVSWEYPSGLRFAVLTKNRTVHMFDLPPSASRWPPARSARRAKQSGAASDTSHGAQNANLGGLFASAMSIASKAQPVVANWRGRAPSISGGLAGIGQTGIGIASATGVRGGKVVAAGLSKSLGAASETVNHIRHAGESRIHLRSSREPTPGRILWTRHGREISLAVVDTDSMKFYRIHKSRSKEKGRRESVSVFDARKAMSFKVPRSFQLRSDLVAQRQAVLTSTGEGTSFSGFYRSHHTTTAVTSIRPLAHPLSYAEIETNAPYQPFHSDRRVSLAVFNMSGQGHEADLVVRSSKSERTSASQWVFGDDIPVFTIDLQKIQIMDESEGEGGGSVIYRETTIAVGAGEDAMEQIVSTTRRSRKKRGDGETDDSATRASRDDFFEDDCEVLDFATDRV